MTTHAGRPDALFLSGLLVMLQGLYVFCLGLEFFSMSLGFKRFWLATLPLAGGNACYGRLSLVWERDFISLF